MYYVYILENEFGSHYIGQTQNIERRLERHLNKGSIYTKRSNTWKLVHIEEVATRSEAFKREKYLKSLKSRNAILKLIDSVKGKRGGSSTG